MTTEQPPFTWLDITTPTTEELGEIARVEGRIETARREYEKALADPVTNSPAATRLSELR